MTGDATVREAGPHDAVMLHLVAAATFPLAVTATISPESVQAFIAEHLSVEQFRSWLASDRHVLFIAEVGSTPAGYSMLTFRETEPQHVSPFLSALPTVELEKFYLLAGRHGTGLATQLLDSSVAAARGRGAASVWLGVSTENDRANRFYERHGFEKRGDNKFPVGADLVNETIRELVL